MAYVTTPAGQFVGVVPDGNEDPNVAFDLLAIAKAVEKRVMGVYATAADRNTKTVAAGVEEGMFAYTKDDDKTWRYSGSAWVEYPTRQAKVGSGPTVPTNSDPNYVNGDIFFKV